MINKSLLEKKLKKIETFLKEIESAKAPDDFQAFYYTLKGLCRTETFGSSEVSPLKF